jgi:outer membrane protein TolC
MYRRAILAALLNLFVLAAPILGAEAPADSAGPRTLAEYLSLARAMNPALRSATADARAARERVGVARGFPDPMVLYGYYFDADPGMEGRSELMLTQPIPFFGKRGLRGDVATHEADATTRMRDAAALDLEYEVKVAYFEFARTHHVAAVLDEERDLVARMRDISFSRYSSGTAEQHEVLKLDATVAQIDDEITMNDHDQDVASRRLCVLIGRDPAAPLPPPTGEVPTLGEIDDDAAVDSALARRPEMAAARAQIDAAESSRRLASREYFPDFVLGLDWEFGGGEDAHGAEMGDSWEAMAGITLPIWIGHRRAAAREAQARRESAEHHFDAVHLAIAGDVLVSVHGVRAAHERVARFEREILPRAEQAFRSAEASYRAGRADFLDYLDSERMWLTMRREYYGVIAELGVQTAALQRALGATE